MSDEHRLQVSTAEQVDVFYAIAGVGNRVLAVTLDFLIIAVLEVGIGLLTGLFLSRVRLPVGAAGVVSALVVLALFLLLPFLYFVLLQALWNGQTLGKRIAGLRVIRDDGGSAGFFAVLAREIVRLLDLLPPALALDVILISVTRRAQRLGDLLAGTVVVKSRVSTDFAKLRLAAPAPARGAVDSEALSGDARALVRDFVRREPTLSASARPSVAAAIAKRIRDRVPQAADYPDDVEFLRAVAASFREGAAG